MDNEKIKKLNHLKAQIAHMCLESGKRKSVIVGLCKDGYFYVDGKKTLYKIGKNYQLERESINITPKKKK